MPRNPTSDKLRIIIKQLREVVAEIESGKLDEPVEPSPVTLFVQEQCELQADATVRKEVLFDAWDKWSQEHSMPPVMKWKFYELIRFASPGIRSETYKEDGRDVNLYCGIKLKGS